MKITINELHNEFFEKILGFNPKTGGIKPVHFINNISRGILGYYFQNIDLYNFIEPRGKDKKLDPKKDGVRFGHSVGTKKRKEIVSKAVEKKFKICNARVSVNGS